MGQVVFFLVLVMLVSGGALYGIKKKLESFERYEFENSSSSGATTFNTFEEAKRFRASQQRWTALRNLVSLPFVFSIFFLIVLWAISK